MKAVLDTNIFISALILPNGQADKAVRGAIERRFVLAISKPIIHEVLDVLARKFDHDAENLAHVAVFLFEVGSLTSPGKPVHVLHDEPDNRMLECALASRAELIVTGDRAMLALDEFEGTRIMTLREFLNAIA